MRDRTANISRRRNDLSAPTCPPPRPYSAALAPSLSGAHRLVAASRLRVRLHRASLYKLARHAPRALHSPIPMASLRPICRAPLRQLTSRFPPSIAPRASLRQWRGYATTLDAQQKVPSTVHNFEIKSLLTRTRSSRKTLNRQTLQSTKLSTGLVIISSTWSQNSHAYNTTTTGEEPPKALYQPHSLRELYLASSSRCSRQCHAE